MLFLLSLNFFFKLHNINRLAVALPASLFLLLSSHFELQAQKSNKTNPDSIYVPKSLKRKVKHLTKRDSSDTQKFYHICKWIIKKKSYDLKGFEEIRLKNYPIQKLWRKKKLLCREYTRILEAMCKEAGITCFDVDGYIKGIYHYPYKRFYYQEHEWNVIELDGKYQIADLTWASGYAVPRISLWGRFKKLIKRPYLPRRWKFVKKPDYYYLDIPPNELTITHLPVHPMWQLNEHPISIKKFEEENKPTIDTTTISYPYLQKIQHYNSRSKMEQILISADEGYKFNPKNNYHKGAGYLQYAYRDWSSFHKKKLAPKDKLMRSESLKKNAQESELYLRRFLDDNRRIRQHLWDSLRLKNREVNSFIGRYSSITKRKVNEVNLKIRVNQRKNILSNLIIARKKIERGRNTDHRAINRTQRASKKQKNPKILENIKISIASNNQRIKNLHEILPPLDSVLNEVTITQRLQDSIIHYENIKRKLLQYALVIDINTNNKYYLRRIHQWVDSIHNLIIFSEKDLKKNESKDYIKLSRYRDSICIRAIKTLNSNKGLIIRLKKLSINNNDEEDQFKEQIEELHFWYDEFTKTQNYLKATRSRSNRFYKNWESLLKGIQKDLRLYFIFEKYIYRRHIKHENYRYKVYNYAGRVATAESVLLRRKAVVMINDSKKLIKQKK